MIKVIKAQKNQHYATIEIEYQVLISLNNNYAYHSSYVEGE